MPSPGSLARAMEYVAVLPSSTLTSLELGVKVSLGRLLSEIMALITAVV